MGPKGVTLLKSDRMLLPDAIKLNLPYKKAVPCHRLDKETGGVMLCSKSKLAERTIMVSFRYKLVRKKYLALVIGKLEPPQGVISLPISGKPASTKFAVTSYTRSAQYEWLTTVQLWPITGKRHQLRRHMQAVGHSIVGDKRYSMAELWDTVVRTDIPHMFLWAVEIDFPHPQHCTGLVDGTTEDLRMGALNDSGSDEEDAYGAEDDIDDTAQPAAAERGGVNIIDGSRARQQGMAQIIERVRTLPAACRVVASIDEPSYYGVFREIHQRSWDENQTEDAVQS